MQLSIQNLVADQVLSVVPTFILTNDLLQNVMRLQWWWILIFWMSSFYTVIQEGFSIKYETLSKLAYEFKNVFWKSWYLWAQKSNQLVYPWVWVVGGTIKVGVYIFLNSKVKHWKQNYYTANFWYIHSQYCKAGKQHNVDHALLVQWHFSSSCLLLKLFFLIVEAVLHMWDQRSSFPAKCRPINPRYLWVIWSQLPPKTP